VPLDEVEPGNKITQELKKLIMSTQREAGASVAPSIAAPQKKFKMSLAQ
jgi:hypothetical protein